MPILDYHSGRGILGAYSEGGARGGNRSLWT